MKHVICIFFVWSAMLVRAQPLSSETNVVKHHLQIQQDLWNAGNIAGFMNYYHMSDSLMFIGSKGITYGWQKTKENYLQHYPDKTSMGELKFEIVRIEQLSSESIFVIGKWDLKKEKPAGGYFTLLWKKINNEWVIVCDHSS